jgi:electron transfer flavoprotein alpha subunit
MTNDILVVVEQLEGKVSEITFELLGKGRELARALGGKLCALLVGSDVKNLAGELGAADRLLVADHPGLAHYVPDAFKQTLVEVVKTHRPRLVLTSGTALGMDQAAGLSAELGLPLVAYARDLRLDGNGLVVISQLYGGKIFSESLVEGAQAVVSVVAGAFSADAGKASGSPSIEEFAPVTASSRIKFKRLIEPEAGDVDITREAILVSVGRGIQSKDNIGIVEELANALGAALSASRPIVDNGWLPKTRQVGKSGMTVKPKLYIAVGISGAPEHVEGMKDAELILAINTDQAAPIFNVAHYGVVSDLFDVIPLLTEKIKAAG